MTIVDRGLPLGRGAGFAAGAPAERAGGLPEQRHAVKEFIHRALLAQKGHLHGPSEAGKRCRNRPGYRLADPGRLLRLFDQFAGAREQRRRLMLGSIRIDRSSAAGIKRAVVSQVVRVLVDGLPRRRHPARDATTAMSAEFAPALRRIRRQSANRPMFLQCRLSESWRRLHSHCDQARLSRSAGRSQQAAGQAAAVAPARQQARNPVLDPARRRAFALAATLLYPSGPARTPMSVMRKGWLRPQIHTRRARGPAGV